jgi:hypothetical protein
MGSRLADHSRHIVVVEESAGSLRCWEEVVRHSRCTAAVD